jgi:16S rRNA (cytidine1402-2'-O)-methyltransferase
VGTLYLVATPIGNLEDITLRALRTLREVDLVAAEDTRHTRKLLESHDIRTPLLSYHDHNKQLRVTEILAHLQSGSVALVSDAGTPLLSDPGYRLVNAALDKGHEVVPIPGPAAPIAALVASGLPTDSFQFVGYLPRKAAARRKLLASLASQSVTIVAFEAPHRLQATLEDLEQTFGAQRAIAVCRELTKVHEEIVRGPVGEIAAHYAGEEPRGEITLVIAGTGTDRIWDEASVRREVSRRIASGLRRTDAAKQVAAQAGWPRKAVYRLAGEEE